MKILVTYFSQTGNTEKMASVIYKEASLKNDAVLTKYNDVDIESLHEYDLIFIGAPVHAGSIAKEVKEFLVKLPSLPGKSLAGFITHAETAYPQKDLDQMAVPFVQASSNTGMEYKGCFGCQGYLADFMHEAVQKMKEVSDEEWAEMKKIMTSHPNFDDEAAAMAYANSVLT